MTTIWVVIDHFHLITSSQKRKGFQLDETWKFIADIFESIEKNRRFMFFFSTETVLSLRTRKNNRKLFWSFGNRIFKEKNDEIYFSLIEYSLEIFVRLSFYWMRNFQSFLFILSWWINIKDLLNYRYEKKASSKFKFSAVWRKCCRIWQ